MQCWYEDSKDSASSALQQHTHAFREVVKQCTLHVPSLSMMRSVLQRRQAALLNRSRVRCHRALPDTMLQLCADCCCHACAPSGQLTPPHFAHSALTAPHLLHHLLYAAAGAAAAVLSCPASASNVLLLLLLPCLLMLLLLLLTALRGRYSPCPCPHAAPSQALADPPAVQRHAMHASCGQCACVARQLLVNALPAQCLLRRWCRSAASIHHRRHLPVV